MIWHPSCGPGGVWRSPELELVGTVLHLRSGENRLQIDLRDPAVEMTLHHFSRMRGTILLLRSPPLALTIAGEGYAATDFLYADEPLDRPALLLPRPFFEKLHHALDETMRASAPAPARRSFLLWPNTYRLFWTLFGTRKPVLLEIDGDQLTLSRLDPKETVRSWRRDEARVAYAIWKTPSGKTGGSQECPVVEIRLGEELILSTALILLILPRHAPRAAAPQYFVDQHWSRLFMESVVPESVRQRAA